MDREKWKRRIGERQKLDCRLAWFFILIVETREEYT